MGIDVDADVHAPVLFFEFHERVLLLLQYFVDFLLCQQAFGFGYGVALVGKVCLRRHYLVSVAPHPRLAPFRLGTAYDGRVGLKRVCCRCRGACLVRNLWWKDMADKEKR